ncbi:MAG: hypothetical protein ACYTGG_12730 [Planctomycetota bacterium]|jgi:hypothetical protein
MKRIVPLTLASSRLRVLAALALSLAAAPLATAQDCARLLEDFVHYTFVAKPDLAAGFAQELLDCVGTDGDLVILLDEGPVSTERFDQAISRARSVPELEVIAAEIEIRVENGRLSLAREQDRINEAIQMLIGTQRQQLLAERRLESAGEYAVPALLREIMEGRNERLKLQCERMLVRIGREAVTPLSAALPHVEDNTQRVLCDILGEIGWNHAAPFLRELSLDAAASGPVQEAAARAFRNVGGREVELSNLYSMVAQRYFDGAESLVAYPFEDSNNVWDYDNFIGLESTPVPTDIYHEVMAMRMSGSALRVDPANRKALSLFVAANLKRENELPAGDGDPIFGGNPYGPEFYATVFGTSTCMDVLAMAVESVDTPLVRDAIAALAKTTGGSNLFSFSDGAGRQPLLLALEYPARRVRYEAALTLGRALPDDAFPGDSSVVPLLASAVRTGNRMFALVIVHDEEDRRGVSRRLVNLGFDIIAAESNLASVRDLASASIGIDLVVVSQPTPEDAQETIQDLRHLPRAAAAPVLLVATGLDYPGLEREYHSDASVKVWRPLAGSGEREFGAAVDEVLLRVSGGRMTESESEVYAIEALSALRDIALTSCPAYDIRDAEPALLDAMVSRQGGTRLLVGDILALMDSEPAQNALLSAALAGGENQIDMLQRAADSVKRFGNRAQPHQVTALLELIRSSEGETADAAARLHGAMNLPSDDAIELIPK